MVLRGSRLSAATAHNCSQVLCGANDRVRELFRHFSSRLQLRFKLIAKCLENHLTQTCRQSTINGYRDLLERYTKSYLWHMRIRDIDPDHIIRLMKQLENHGLNHTSRKRVRGVVGNILQIGVEQRIIAINAVKLTPVPKKDYFHQKTRVMDPLTKQEAIELIYLAQSHELGVLIQISINT
jgi:hypothetical protein